MKPRPMVPFFLAAVASGCTCSKETTKTVGAPGQSSASTEASSSSVALQASTTDTAPSFSAPIAARLVDGHVWAAGLVVGAGAIRLTSLTPAGAAEWTSDVLHGVGWRADASLRVLPIAGGAAITWYGTLGNKLGHFVVLVGPKGEPLAPPFEATAVLCATSEGIVWAESSRSGATKIKMRRLGDADSRDLVTTDAASSLVCGDRAVYAMVADNDRTAALVYPPESKSAAPIRVVDEAEYDDEREFETYAVGDDLGIVRANQAGEIFVREMSKGALGAWKKLRHTLDEGDDVVRVDADATTVAIVYFSDASEKCGGRSGQRAHGLAVDRKTKRDTLRELGAPLCGSEIPNVWTGESAGKPILVGWPELQSRADVADATPFRGFAYGSMGDGLEGRRIEVRADAITDAGCDANGCYVVALARAVDTDGMAPEALRLIRYP